MVLNDYADNISAIQKSKTTLFYATLAFVESNMYPSVWYHAKNDYFFVVVKIDSSISD